MSKLKILCGNIYYNLKNTYSNMQAEKWFFILTNGTRKLINTNKI
jgi:hypothetical protein